MKKPLPRQDDNRAARMLAWLVQRRFYVLLAVLAFLLFPQVQWAPHIDGEIWKQVFDVARTAGAQAVSAN